MRFVCKTARSRAVLHSGPGGLPSTPGGVDAGTGEAGCTVAARNLLLLALPCARFSHKIPTA
jgi:hypothetical protein